MRRIQVAKNMIRATTLEKCRAIKKFVQNETKFKNRNSMLQVNFMNTDANMFC